MARRKPHYQGDYDTRRTAVVTAATLDPTTRCWRCGRTLAEHPPHKTGKPVRWTAGHTRDGDSSYPLAAEASTCNYQAGATYGNTMRVDPQSERWW